jgi:hypothetical protein
MRLEFFASYQFPHNRLDGWAIFGPKLKFPIRAFRKIWKGIVNQVYTNRGQYRSANCQVCCAESRVQVGRIRTQPSFMSIVRP